MKVIALKPEESETLERAFYEADSYERLISVLGRQLNAEASALTPRTSSCTMRNRAAHLR